MSWVSRMACKRSQYIEIAVVVSGAGYGKYVLRWQQPHLAYVQICGGVADLHYFYSNEEGLKGDLPTQIQSCGWELLCAFIESIQHQLMARSWHLPSREPKRGRNSDVTPAFSGVPGKGGKIRSGYITPAFSGAHKWAELLRKPCILGSPQCQAWEENMKWLPHPCLLGGPEEGRIEGRRAMSPQHSRGSPTPSEGENEKWLPHPCLLRAPKEGRIATQPLRSRGSPTPSAGRKSEVVASPLLYRGPKRVGGIATQPLHSRGSPAKRRNSKLATSPLPSWGPINWQKCFVTPAFLGVPKQGDNIRIGHPTPTFLGAEKWSELLRNPCIHRGPLQRGEIQNWLLTRDFSGAQKRRDLLLNPCILGGPQQRGQNQKWLPHHCLLAIPQMGGIAK